MADGRMAPHDARARHSTPPLDGSAGAWSPAPGAPPSVIWLTPRAAAHADCRGAARTQTAPDPAQQEAA